MIEMLSTAVVHRISTVRVHAGLKSKVALALASIQALRPGRRKGWTWGHGQIFRSRTPLYSPKHEHFLDCDVRERGLPRQKEMTAEHFTS